MNCPTCNHELDDLATKLNVADRWWTIEDLLKGSKYTIDGVGEVEMVVPPAPAEYDSYGETFSEQIFMVIKVGDRHFKKEGFRSSYGGTSWYGPCREVHPEPKTVTVYDYV